MFYSASASLYLLLLRTHTAYGFGGRCICHTDLNSHNFNPNFSVRCEDSRIEGCMVLTKWKDSLKPWLVPQTSTAWNPDVVHRDPKHGVARFDDRRDIWRCELYRGAGHCSEPWRIHDNDTLRNSSWGCSHDRKFSRRQQTLRSDCQHKDGNRHIDCFISFNLQYLCSLQEHNHRNF